MKFSSEKVAFGRHETFHLRFSWLSKGFVAFQKDSKLFNDADKATVTLGVGKNMVSAIRYWLRATRLINATDNKITSLGSLIFDSETGEDPFLEDEGTLWLIHWLLASNTTLATTLAWFFSKYHKSHFNQSELRAALSSYLQESVKTNRRPAMATLKNDVSVLARLYAKTQSANVAEDVLDSPLSELGLIVEHGKTAYSSSFGDQVTLPSEIVGFAILQVMSLRDSKIMPVAELIQSVENFVSPCSVFRLSESAFMTKLEELVRNYPENLALRETARIRQLFLNEPLSDLDLLKAYYDNQATTVERVA